jgi:hypothetical protein
MSVTTTGVLNSNRNQGIMLALAFTRGMVTATVSDALGMRYVAYGVDAVDALRLLEKTVRVTRFLEESKREYILKLIQEAKGE